LPLLFRAVGLSAALFLTAGAAQAQHLHAGDVELGTAGGVIVVDPEGLAERAANGYVLYEAISATLRVVCSRPTTPVSYRNRTHCR
jgi:hypothetical protein